MGKNEKMTLVKVTPAGSWNWQDAAKSAIIGIGTPILYYLQEFIPNWDVEPIYKIAISATITYLLKNFFTTSIKEVK